MRGRCPPARPTTQFATGTRSAVALVGGPCAGRTQPGRTFSPSRCGGARSAGRPARARRAARRHPSRQRPRRWCARLAGDRPQRAFRRTTFDFVNILRNPDAATALDAGLRSSGRPAGRCSRARPASAAQMDPGLRRPVRVLASGRRRAGRSRPCDSGFRCCSSRLQHAGRLLEPALQCLLSKGTWSSTFSKGADVAMTA